MHMACVVNVSRDSRATFLRACGACMAHARMLAGVRPSRGPYWLCSVSMPASGSVIPSRDGTLRNSRKHGFWGPRPGPESGLGWASALLGYILGIYLTPRHPSSHATSRACARAAHSMPCCMRCLHALRGRPVQARIAPPRATGLVSSSPWVDVLPPMAGYPGGVR